MKRLSNKGFTLIELLATILIIGLVLGLTAYGIISSVDSAKKEGSKLTLVGIKEAARTYSSEYTDDTWKASNKSDNIYFCTTIQELINKGLLDKNAKNVEDNKIKLNDYIAVVKDKKTKVIKKEFVLTSSINENEKDNDKTEAYEYCTGNKKPEDIKKNPTIKGEDTYTDTIIAEFTDAEFKTKDGSSSNIKERKCSYTKSRTDGGNAEFEDKNTTINDNKCEITGLESNTEYDIRICMTSNNDSEACTTKNTKTKDIKKPTISISDNDSIKITYDDTNIRDENGNQNGNHYFMSTKDGTSDKSVVSYDRDKQESNGNSTTSIIKNNWYKVNDKEVTLTYTEDGNFDVTAETRDKSNNYKQTDKNFSLYKIVFLRGTADKIDGNTSDIKKLCLADRVADRGKTCSITSPSIERNNYEVIGWNTDSNATTSSWNADTKKNISSSGTYYPITKLNKIKITINANGGTGGTSVIWYYYGVNKIYSDEACTKEINKINVSMRTGYTLKHYYGDGTSGGNNGERYIYKDGSFADDLVTDIYKDTTLYADWNINKIKIKYNMNGGSLSSNNSSFSTSGSYITLNGSTIIETYNYGDKLGVDGLYNYNNSAYINIVRKGYTAVNNQEWYNDAKKTFSQATRYNANDLCDASKSDCEVTLYVNWTVVKTKVIFYANGGTFSNGNSSYSFMAEPGTYSFNNNYYLSGMPTVSKSGCSLSGWYYHPETKVIYSWFSVAAGDSTIELSANWYCSSSGGGGNTGGTKYCGLKQDCYCNVAKECEGCGIQGKTQYFKCDKDPTSSKNQCFWSSDNKVWHSCY